MPISHRPPAARLESAPSPRRAPEDRTALIPRAARMTEPTELLLRRIREGDAQARQALYDRSLPLLLRWAHGRLPQYARTASDTEDLVQTTLMRALRHLDAFKASGSGAFLAYLRQILLNEVRHEIRSQRRHGGAHLAVEDVEIIDEGRSAIELLAGEQRLRAYENALAKLNRRQQELVVLRIEFGLSWQEIALEIGGSVDAVRMTVTRALQRMAEAIGEEHRDGD